MKKDNPFKTLWADIKKVWMKMETLLTMIKDLWIEIKRLWEKKKKEDAEKIIRNFLLLVFYVLLCIFLFLIVVLIITLIFIPFTDNLDIPFSSDLFFYAITFIITLSFYVYFFKVIHKKGIIASFLTSTTLIWMRLSLDAMLENMQGFKSLLELMILVSIISFFYYFFISALEVLFESLNGKKIMSKYSIGPLFYLITIIALFILGFKDPILLIF